MNEALNKMIDGYLAEAEECIRLKDEIQSKTYFKKMMAGMEMQTDWFYSLMFTHVSKSRNGSYLDEMPLVIQKLNSYKIARQDAFEQMKITGQPPPSVFNFMQHQSQSQQQSITVSFDQVISWVQDNPSLGSAETEEILGKLQELKDIAESPASAKSKWDNMKLILSWLGTQGVELAKMVLPLILMAVR